MRDKSIQLVLCVCRTCASFFQQLLSIASLRPTAAEVGPTGFRLATNVHPIRHARWPPEPASRRHLRRPARDCSRLFRYLHGAVQRIDMNCSVPLQVRVGDSNGPFRTLHVPAKDRNHRFSALQVRAVPVPDRFSALQVRAVPVPDGFSALHVRAVPVPDGFYPLQVPARHVNHRLQFRSSSEPHRLDLSREW